MPEDIVYKAPDGLELFAKSYGPENATLTVLCMHGLTRNHKDFEPMIAALPERYRFLAVDVRGRGRSARDPNPENYTPPVYAADMQALLDHLGINQAALIGTSMGGLMAMIMMHQMPERIRGVVLNDVGPVLNRKGLDRIAAYVGEVTPEPSWQAAAKTAEAAQKAVFPDYSEADWLDFARRTYRDTEDGRVVLDYDPAITRAVADARPGLRVRFAMWRLFAKLKQAPLLILRGERSDILAETTAERMQKRHKQARLVTVPNVGHAPMLNEAAALEAIEAFLRDL